MQEEDKSFINFKVIKEALKENKEDKIVNPSHYIHNAIEPIDYILANLPIWAEIYKNNIEQLELYTSLFQNYKRYLHKNGSIFLTFASLDLLIFRRFFINHPTMVINTAIPAIIMPTPGLSFKYAMASLIFNYPF